MKTTLLVIGVIGILLVAGFFVYNSMSDSSTNSTTGAVVSQQSSTDSSGQTTRVINVVATRFDYTPGTITVKKGEHVKIIIDNPDTKHGIVIPSLGISGIDSIEFTADTVGTFDFKCPTMCGSGHREMKGTLIVEE